MSDAEYEALEAQWTPLLRKFAGWSVPGMDSEDIMQEMRIVLLKCRRKCEADPTKHTKFITLLYGSCLNIMLNLLRDRGISSEKHKAYAKYVPADLIFSLCTGEHGSGECDNARCTASALESHHDAGGLSDLDLINLFGNVSTDAKWLIGLMAREPVTTVNQDKDPRWSKSMVAKAMGRKRFKQGIEELKVMLKGGLS